MSLLTTVYHSDNKQCNNLVIRKLDPVKDLEIKFISHVRAISKRKHDLIFYRCFS